MLLLTWVTPLVYDSVAVLFFFFLQMWDESLSVNLGSVAFKKVMLAFEFDVIEEIPFVQVRGLYLVLSFSKLLFSILS